MTEWAFHPQLIQQQFGFVELLFRKIGAGRDFRETLLDLRFSQQLVTSKFKDRVNPGSLSGSCILLKRSIVARQM